MIVLCCPLQKGVNCQAVEEQNAKFCPLAMVMGNEKDEEKGLVVICAIKRIAISLSRIEYNIKWKYSKKNSAGEKNSP